LGGSFSARLKAVPFPVKVKIKVDDKIKAKGDRQSMPLREAQGEL
jgi:hypothetical protein